jgi:hypothetical protein
VTRFIPAMCSPRSRPIRRRWKSRPSATNNRKILVPEGAQDQSQCAIALLLGEGEEASALANLPAPAPEPPPVAPSRQQREGPPPPDVTAEAAPRPASAPSGQRGDGRIFASPLARRMAQHAGLDLTAIRGSGPGAASSSRSTRPFGRSWRYCAPASGGCLGLAQHLRVDALPHPRRVLERVAALAGTCLIPSDRLMRCGASSPDG